MPSALVVRSSKTEKELWPFHTGEVGGVLVGAAPLHGALAVQAFVLFITAAHMVHRRLLCASMTTSKKPICAAVNENKAGRAMR